MKSKAKEFAVYGLLPAGVLIGTITYTMAFSIYILTWIFKDELINFTYYLIPILGFIGPFLVYAQNIKASITLKALMFFSCLLLFYLEIIVPINFIEIFGILDILLFLLVLIALPLSFLLGRIVPTKTQLVSKVFFIDIFRLIIISSVLWFAAPYCLFLVLYITKAGIDSVVLLGFMLAPSAALLSSLNLELFNYIALKISNYKKPDQS